MKRVVGLLFLVAGAVVAFGQEITVAAASDLQFAMPELVRHFEQQSGARVKVSYGSSGNFFAQIQNGAPFDVFFSADESYPQKLEAAGLTAPGTLQRYAKGKLALWVRNDSKLDLNQGPRVLLDSQVRKIAIANPSHAPYGRAAVAALQSEGLYERVKERLVLGENISQAAQFVDTGNADIGVIALSLAKAPSMSAKGRYAPIAESSYPAIQQACVVLKGSKQQQVARRLVEYVMSAEGQDVLRQFGLGK
jgi:molybdate transport system substrate-binding protein